MGRGVEEGWVGLGRHRGTDLRIGVEQDTALCRIVLEEVRMGAIRYSKITIRQPELLKAKVEKAAALRGMTVTSFINGILELAADKTIGRIEARELTERDSAALLAMLVKPSRPNAALRRAAKRHREISGG